jgi:hypothetical protein
MTKPENYVPKIHDPVLIEGDQIRFVVVGINASKKTAELRPVGSAIVLRTNVPWSTFSYLDESQSSARIVKEPTER